MARRLLRGSLSNVSSRLIAITISFLLTPFILHRLGPTQYGLWVLLGALIGFSALLDLGIGRGITKYVAEMVAKGETLAARSLIATALRTYVVLGFTAFALSAAFAPAIPQLFGISPDTRDQAAWLFVAMGLTSGLTIATATARSVLQGLERYDLLNLVETAAALGLSAAIVAALLFGAGLIGLVLVHIPITLLAFVGTVICIHRVAPELSFGWRGASAAHVRPLLKFTSPVFAVQLAGQLQMRSDEIVIALFLPLSAVTPYSLARRLSGIGSLLTGQALRPLLPLASHLDAKDDRVRVRSLYVGATRVTLAILLPVAAVVIILARPILTAWVGPEYGDIGILVAILTLASVIDSSTWPAGYVLQGMDRHHPVAAMAVGSALANLALSVVLVQQVGIIGVAIGTLVPTTVECLAIVLPYAARVVGVSFGVFVKEVVLSSLVPAVPAGLVLLVLRETAQPSSPVSIGLVAAAGVTAYVASYLRIGATSAELETYRRLAAGTARFAGSGLAAVRKAFD